MKGLCVLHAKRVESLARDAEAGVGAVVGLAEAHGRAVGATCRSIETASAIEKYEERRRQREAGDAVSGRSEAGSDA